MVEATWTIKDCDARLVAELAAALEVSHETASVLVRRGYSDPAVAAAFLAGELPGHDPFALGDMREACDRIRAAIDAKTRICVHGDYDVDGICATALAVLVLRELGAEVEWHLPSRFEEGYGVAGETLDRLAAEGCGLVLTVDCGITAVEEIRAARAAGLDVIVTDHHRPGDELPDCPIVATRPSDYPFPELCGTGVVYKLGEALLGAATALEKHLDLVALATIADVVPLARREPGARARRAQAALHDHAAGPARADARRPRRPGRRRRGRGRLPSCPADQRRRPARPPDRRARAAPHRRRGDREADRSRAGGAEPRAAGRRGPHPPRGPRRDRRLAGGPPQPPRLRRRRRRAGTKA